MYQLYQSLCLSTNGFTISAAKVRRVCDHNSLGCQVLWRMADRLVPHVPLRRRTWLDQGKMSKARVSVPRPSGEVTSEAVKKWVATNMCEPFLLLKCCLFGF